MGCVNCNDNREELVLQMDLSNKRGVSRPPRKKKTVTQAEIAQKYAKQFRHVEIIKNLTASGEKFTDDEFPPDHTILNKMGKSPASWKNYTFRRATEFMDPKSISVFQGIDPNDIRQGALGDCYFLCCLSVLAERPLLVERLLITEEFNHAGCYAVWLNDSGKWRSFILDDFIPCSPSGLPAFTKSNGNELWVLLLEKAYAKMFGGYDIIEGGLPQFALRDLTGAPYDCLESSDADQIWNYIDESNRKNYLLTCYTKSTNIREEQNPLGIVAGHAYSILDAREVTLSDGSRERIIEIRNPWGKFEWKGDWSDDSDKWTEDVIKQVETFKKADDGTFWMSVNDFVKFYEGVGICKLHEDYFYTSASFEHEKPMPTNLNVQPDDDIPYENPSRTVVRLNIERKTHIFLSASQDDDRKFIMRPGEPYTYSSVRMMVGKITSGGLRYVAGTSNCDRDVVIESVLTRGVYIVTVEVMWSQEYNKKFHLSAYSQHPVFFERIGNANFCQIERNILKSFAIHSPNARCKDYANIQEPNIKRLMGSELGLVYFYYQNKGRSTLKETVTMGERNNLRICAPFTNNKSFEVVVPPGSDAIVIYKSITLGEYSFSIRSNFSRFNLSREEVEEVRRNQYLDTVYIDDPYDAIQDRVDTDCYNQFIKNDRDNIEIEEEKKSEPPEPESDDIPIQLHMIVSNVKGELMEEKAEFIENVEKVLSVLGTKDAFLVGQS